MWRRALPAVDERPSGDDTTGWLISECQTVATHIANLALVGERIMATTAAVGALAASVAISNGKGYLLMGLPFALSVVTTYKLYLNDDAMALRAYKAALEQEIFRRTGMPIIQYESRVRRTGHSYSQTTAVAALVLLSLVSVSVVAVNEALETYRPHHWGHENATMYLTMTVASIIIGFSAISICSFPANRTKRRVFDLVQSSLEQSSSEKPN